VVDDNSPDGTGEVADKLAAEFPGRLSVVHRTAKDGLGRAYVEGMTRALEDGADYVVQMDADLSHPVGYVPQLLGTLHATNAGVVIGSRYVPGGTVIGWPRRRTWLSRWGNRYAAIVLGLAVNDATAGYRVYRTDTLRRIGIDGVQAGGYGFQVEMTYRVVRAGLGVVEIPIAFRDRVAGQSKMHRGIIIEAFTLVTWWGLADLITLRRRHRAYREPR